LFKAPSGIIKTPNFPKQNYENSKTCEWSIKTDSTHTLSLQFTDIDIDNSANCTKDYLEVIDPIFNETLWRGCGNPPLNETIFKSKRNELLVRLVSDNATNAKGFIGNYSVNCGGRFIANDSGEIQYRRATDENDCSWTIIAEDPSKHVTLTFTYLSVFYSDPEICIAEISVYEGDSDNLGAKRATFCGGKAPASIISNGNALTIRMNSSNFPNYGEFDIHYSIMDNGEMKFN
jgi:cubilin